MDFETRLDPDQHDHLMSPKELKEIDSQRDKDECPPIDASLVAWLKRNYPRRDSYRNTDSLSQIMREEGRWDVIRELITIHKNQQGET